MEAKLLYLSNQIAKGPSVAKFSTLKNIKTEGISASDWFNVLHWPYFSVVIHSVLPFNIEKHVAFASRFPEAPLCLYHLSVETDENSLESSGGKL